MTNQAVVTQLVIESDESGAVSYARAMAAAQLASEQASAANDNYARSIRSVTESAGLIASKIDSMASANKAAADQSSSSWASFAVKVALYAAAAYVGLQALYGAFKAIYEVVTIVPRLLGEAWELGNAKLAEYVEMSKKATAADTSVDFFQRISKAADGAKTSVDDLAKMFAKLTEASAGKLGGSDAEQRLKELTKAGNFKGNTGVAAFNGANDSEERLRAAASLIDQAFKSGQRLAGLDFAKTIFGDEAANRLAKYPGYLNDMLAAADKLQADDLVKASDVANAVELQNRLDAAEKILSQRWHPIQDVLTQLGIKMKEAWVDIVEAAAAAFDWVAKIAEKLGSIPSGFWTLLVNGGAAVATALGPIGALFSAPATITSIVSNSGSTPAGDGGSAATAAQMADAKKRLAPAMNRKFDSSKDPNAEDNTPDTAAFQRAEEALRKYIETNKAAADTIDQTTAAQERAKAMAQLVAAGMKDGLSREAATAKAQMSGLADAAAAAAQALAKARVAADIKFNRNTALLSQQDVQIAQQLKGLYPDVATALGSVEAQGIRVNNAMKTLAQSLENELTNGLTDIAMRTKSVGQGFTDMGMAVLKALEQMIIKIAIVQPLMQALQASVTSSGILGFLGIGGGGLPGTAGSSLFGPLAPSAHGNLFSAGNIIPFAQGGVIDSPSIAPMALFGEAGPEAIVPLRRGADGNLGIASQGGGSQSNFTYAPTIDARGADAQAVARLAQVVANDKKNFEKSVQAVVTRTRLNNPGAWR